MHEEIDDSIQFAVTQGGIVLLGKIFDSEDDDCDTIIEACKGKSIFCVCEGSNDETYAGFMSNFHPDRGGYARDDDAFVAIASTNRIYRPQHDDEDEEDERHDVGMYTDAAPCWGDSFLYFGSSESFEGAYCGADPIYDEDVEDVEFEVNRLCVFEAISPTISKLRLLPIMMVDDELTALQTIYNGIETCQVGEKIELESDENIKKELSNRNERTVSIDDPQTLQKLCKYNGNFKNAPFLVLEVSGCTKEHAELVASLFSDDNNIFNHDRMRCLRVLVESTKDAQFGGEVARMCPKHLRAIEFCPASGDTLSTAAYNIITSVPASMKLGVKLFVINSQSPSNINLHNTINALQLNDGVAFILKLVSVTNGPSFLEMEAVRRFSEIPDVTLPPVVPFRDVKWGKTFGFQTIPGLVSCDFKDLHKHSITLQNMYDLKKDGKEPTDPLERYAGTSVATRTVAVQLVVLFVSAKDTDRKPVFASEEATKDAKKHPWEWRYSLSDEKFISYITANSSGPKDEMLLCGEILGIASFLHMPALQRLVRRHLARLCKTEHGN